MITAKESVHTGTNKPIIVIEGNTYPIYKQLGRSGLGFNWYAQGKFWWLYKDQVDSNKLASMQKLGIDLSSLNQNQVTSSPVTQNENVESIPEIPASHKNMTNKTDVDNDAPSERYYGFKVKKDIISFNHDIKIDDNIVPVKIVVNRLYKKGLRKLPIYTYEIYVQPENEYVGRTAEKAPAEWGKYDEDAFVTTIPQKIQSRFDAKEKSRMYLVYQSKQKLKQRDPQMTDFLKQWNDNSYNKEFNLEGHISSKLPTRYIDITEPGYEGRYPVGLELLGHTIYLNTSIKDDLTAPTRSMIGSVPIDPEIRNIEELNKYIDKVLSEEKDDIAKRYVKYLKSFPYSKEEKEKSKQSMIDIVNMIGTNYNVEFFEKKLMELGFVRPSKKGKKNPAGGMVVQDDIVYVLDDSKIRSAVFGRGTSNHPEYFYAVLAYYLMRKARNISSMSELLLVSNMSKWVDLARQYGHKMELRDIDNYLGQLVNLVYTDLFGKAPPKDTWQQYADFYNAWHGGGAGKVEEEATQTNTNALEDFAQFATQFGFSPQDIQASPKKVYRSLAFKFHPDSTQEQNKELAEENFKRLTELYEALPQEYKTASNWYQKIRMAAVGKNFSKRTCTRKSCSI